MHKKFFRQKQARTYGFTIIKEGIMPLPNKVEAIENISVPTTKKQLQSFIGSINY